MNKTLLYLLRPALIPKLCANISAGTPCNRHSALVSVSTVRAFPDKFSMLVLYNLDFSVIPACLTIITLGIKLCIHDIIIDILHDGKYCLNIVLKIRNLHIADCSTRRKSLERSLEFQLVKCIDLFRYMHMIAVCDIVLICDTRNDAESFLQTFCKLVCCGFQRSPIN